MKRTIFMLLAAFFLVITLSVSAEAVTEKHYWPLDTDLLDNWGTANGTANGDAAITGSCYGSKGCATFDGTGDYITFGLDLMDSYAGNYTVSLRYRTSDHTPAALSDIFDSEGRIVYYRLQTNGSTYYGTYNGASTDLYKGTAGSDNTWYHVIMQYDGTNMKYYLDNVLVGTVAAPTPDSSTSRQTLIGTRYSLNADFLGDIAQVKVWQGQLTSEQRTNDYDCDDYTGCAVDPFAHVQVFDLYDNSTLSGLTVYEGTLSNTTDGSGIAYFYNNDGLNYTVDGSPLYFNVSGTATQNDTTQVSVYGAFPDISAYNVEGTNVLSFNLTSPQTSNTTSDGSAELLLPPNVTTLVNVSAAGYYALSSNVSTTAQDVSSKNITGLYQTLVTINATNAYTGSGLVNFSGWVYNNETGYNVSFNDSGTGTATVQALNGQHMIYIDVSGYSLSADNFDQSNYTANTYNKTFALYSNNSILINIYDEEDNTLITENVTITVSGNTTENIYYTTTGSYFLENLLDGNYSIKLEASNYTLRTYEVTVADKSTQTLNAFLSPSTDTVTLAIIDFDTSQPIEGASIIQQRLINSTWTTVESKSSDITGRAQFTYTIGVKYRFTVTATGYNDKVFELDPIIFTSYNIRMEKDLILDSNTGYFDVTFTYYYTNFTNEENNSFTFTFGSVGGSLESYGYLISYPGGSHGGTGTNANGGTFANTSFLITGADFDDRVNITFWYDSVFGDNKTYTVQYMIDGAADPGTIYDIKNEDYGLGTVEKILIAVVFALFFAGILTLFGSPILGVLGGLLALGFFTFIGFLSVWVVIPSLVVGFLLLARRSSE